MLLVNTLHSRNVLTGKLESRCPHRPLWVLRREAEPALWWALSSAAPSSGVRRTG